MSGSVQSRQTAGTCTGGHAGTVQLLAATDVTIGTGGDVDANGSPCTGGTVRITGGGSVTLAAGATVAATHGGAAATGATGGTVTISATLDFLAAETSTISVNGGQLSAGSITIAATRTGTLNGDVLAQATAGTTGRGGPISVITGCALNLTGRVISSGPDPGANLVHLEGCDVTISGFVQSGGVGHSTPIAGQCRNNNGKPANSTGCVEVWAHRDLTVTGEIDADTGGSGGSSGTSWIDLFARGDINIVGTSAPAPYAVHANGDAGTNDNGGVVTIRR